MYSILVKTKKPKTKKKKDQQKNLVKSDTNDIIKVDNPIEAIEPVIETSTVSKKKIINIKYMI